MAVVVAPIYNGIMEFVPIVMGMVVLNEKFPHNADGSLNVPLTVVRIIAFALIIAGTVILSARAEGGEAEMVAPASEAAVFREMREHPDDGGGDSGKRHSGGE